MDSGTNTGGKSLVERAKAIILTPKSEWPVIAAEKETTGSAEGGHDKAPALWT